MEFSIRPVEIGDGKGINALRRMPGCLKIYSVFRQKE